MTTEHKRQHSLEDEIIYAKHDLTTLMSRPGRQTNFQYVCFSSHMKRHERRLHSVEDEPPLPLTKEEIKNKLIQEVTLDNEVPPV
jgi:hypothetical protein